MTKPPSTSISGLERALICTILSARARTSAIEVAMRPRMTPSRLKALTMRMPVAVSCMSEMTRDSEMNCARATPRTRLISPLMPKMAIGPAISTISDISGLWMNMTTISPTSDRKSRPAEVTTVSST